MFRRCSLFGRSFVPSARRGYTLTELAVVLLVVSVIFGAVWVAVGHAWGNFRVQHATQQLTTFTQNIRQYYMNAKQFAAAGPVTSSLDTVGLFPVEMRESPTAAPGGPINHAISSSVAGGSLEIDSEVCPVGGNPNFTCFRVRMYGINTASCIALLIAVPANDADLGILGVGTQNNTPLQDVATSVISTPAAITPDTAAGWCNAGAANEVDWDFKLHN